MHGKFLFDTNIVIELLNNKRLDFSKEQPTLPTLLILMKKLKKILLYLEGVCFTK